MQKGDKQLHKTDLELIRVNQYMDPKIHVSNDTRSKLPKYFQIGTLTGQGILNRSKKKNKVGRIAEHLLQQD